MNRKTNLRNFSPSPGMGSDVKDTKMISGEATKTKSESETNETTQFKTTAQPKSNLGGEATFS